ncbi:MAG: hypothetical protein R2839_02620 [Thermomicrobiales bacterium]
MKFVSYSVGGEPFRGGLSVNGQVVDLADGASAIGASLPSTLSMCCSLEKKRWPLLTKWPEARPMATSRRCPKQAWILGAAVQNPPTIYLLAGNYQSHIVEGRCGSRQGKDQPATVHQTGDGHYRHKRPYSDPTRFRHARL